MNKKMLKNLPKWLIKRTPTTNEPQKDSGNNSSSSDLLKEKTPIRNRPVQDSSSLDLPKAKTPTRNRPLQDSVDASTPPDLPKEKTPTRNRPLHVDASTPPDLSKEKTPIRNRPLLDSPDGSTPPDLPKEKTPTRNSPLQDSQDRSTPPNLPKEKTSTRNEPQKDLGNNSSSPYLLKEKTPIKNRPLQDSEDGSTPSHLPKEKTPARKRPRQDSGDASSSPDLLKEKTPTRAAPQLDDDSSDYATFYQIPKDKFIFRKISTREPANNDSSDDEPAPRLRPNEKSHKVETIIISSTDDEVAGPPTRNVVKSPKLVRGKTPLKKIQGPKYIDREEMAMLRYILDNELEELIGGNTIWKRMEADEVCPGRSWQSMKNHFRKKTYHHLPRFKLTEEERMRIKKPHLGPYTKK